MAILRAVAASLFVIAVLVACAPFGLAPAPADVPAEDAGADAVMTSADAGADAGPAGAPVVVQSTRSAPNRGRSLEARFGRPLTAGSLLVVFAYGLGDHDLSIADQDGNTFVGLPPARDEDAGSGRLFYCDRAKGTGKPDVIELSVDASSGVAGLVAFEISVARAAGDTTPLLEDDEHAIGNGPSEVTSPPLQTKARQSLVFAAAWCAETDSVPFRAGDGFVEVARDDFFYLVELAVVTPGSHRASAIFPSGLTWGIAAAAFRASGP